MLALEWKGPMILISFSYDSSIKDNFFLGRQQIFSEQGRENEAVIFFFL